MTRSLIATLSLAASLLIGGAAHADEAGDKILAELDARILAPQDMTLRFDVIHQEPGASEPRKMAFTTKSKGLKSVTEFHAPADQKGTRILVLTPQQMYIWLPQFNKIRRVASHMTDQGFMGTAFDYDDIATLTFAEYYTGTVLSETPDAWVVEGTAKPETTVKYKTIRISVDRAMKVVTKIEYINEKGEVARTTTRTNYSCEGEICIFEAMRLTDHTRNDVWTELRTVEWQANTGLSDSLFTVRAIQSGL